MLLKSKIWAPSSAEFGFGEVHLWMSIHECLELVLLLTLLARRFAHGFLLLIEHHFLNRLPRLSVQVRELGVLRLDLLRVDLDVSLKEAVPPVLTLMLLECDLQDALAAVTLDAPQCLVHVDLLAPLTHKDGLVRFALQLNMHVMDTKLDVELLCSTIIRQRDIGTDLVQGLMPHVFICLTTVTCIRLLL